MQALRDDLLNLSSDLNEQIAIVKKATAGGWKSFYKLEKSKKESKSDAKKNGFNNFQGRDYTEDKIKGLIEM